jgi:hypothetical protein
MKREEWREKPEWQWLREQGRKVIDHQHVCSEACTPETCWTKMEELRAKLRKEANEDSPDH